MADAAHYFGGDLIASGTGSLLLATGDDETLQRVLRRLQTSPNADPFNPSYGAGLARFIGRVVDPLGIQAVILAQIKLESAVAQSPVPTVAVVFTAPATTTATVTYVSALSGRTVQGKITLPPSGAITAQLASGVNALA